MPDPVPPLTRNASRRCTTSSSSAAPSAGTAPAVDQLGQGEHPLSRHPQGEHRARAGDRRQHGVEAGAVGQPQVDVGRGVVEPTAAGGRQSLGEPAYGLVVGEADPGQLEARTTVDPDLPGAVDEHVGHPVEPQQRLERPGPDDVPVQRVVDGEHGRVADGSALLAQRLGHQLGGQRRGVARQPFADAVEQLGVLGPTLAHAAARRAAASSTAPPARAARARVPRRDRAGPAPRSIASSSPRWSPIAASSGIRSSRLTDSGETPARLPRVTRCAPGRSSGSRCGDACRGADPGHGQRGDEHDVVAAADRLLDHRVPVTRQVDHDRVEAAPPRREHLAHGERLQRHRSVGRPGQHRQPARARQRLAQRARAQPPGGLEHRVPPDAVGALEPEHPVDARPDRVGVDQQRRPELGGHLGQGRGEHGRPGSARPADHPDRHARGGAAVADVGEQLHQPGLRGRQARPPSRRRPRARRGTARPRPATGRARAPVPVAAGSTRRAPSAQSSPTSTTGAPVHRRSACAASRTTSGTTPAAAQRRCTSATSSGSAETRSGAADIHAPMLRRTPRRRRTRRARACGRTSSRHRACGRELAVSDGRIGPSCLHFDA